MSPPKLTGNAPVTNVLHPVEIVLVKSRWDKLCLTASYSLYRRLCKLLHLNEPLKRYPRFNRCSAAVAGADVVLVFLCLDKKSALFKILYDLLSCVVSVHSGISRVVVHYLCVLGEYIYDRQIVSCTDLKVIRVVRRGDLYNTRSEFHINIAVRNNRYLSVHQRQKHRLSDDVLVPLVLGVDSDSRITQQSLRSCRCKLHISAAIGQRISQMPEMTCLILVFNLSI